MRASGAGWSRELELAAATVEVLHALLRAFLMAHGVKQPPPELRIPRPGAPVESKASVGLRQFRSALLGGGD